MARTRRRSRRSAGSVPFDPERALAPVARQLARNVLANTRLRALHTETLDAIEDEPLTWELLFPPAEARARLLAYDWFDDAARAELRLGLSTFLRSPRGCARPVGRLPRWLAGNLRVLGRVAHLDAVSLDIVLYLLLARQHGPFLSFLEKAARPLGRLGTTRILAAALARPFEEVRAALRDSAPLLASGIAIRKRRSAFADKPGGPVDLLLDPHLGDALAAPGLTREEVLAHFLPRLPEPELDLSDYSHLSGDVDLALRVLRAAIRARTPGVHILLHGPTGTGKTQLARILAHRPGVPAHEARPTPGTGDPEDGARDEAAPARRLGALRLARRVFRPGSAVVVFDEMEELFEWSRGGLAALLGQRSAASPLTSKSGIHELMEEMPVPVVWTTNRTSGVDPAFLRRFTFAIRMEEPPPRQRARIVRRHLGRVPGISPAEIEALALRHRASPAQVATAVRAAALLGRGRPDLATVDRLLVPVEALVQGTTAPPPEAAADLGAYDLDALEADIDLRRLMERLAAWSPEQGGVSVCLAGPPGTGKTAFARALARRADRPLLRRNASDILSKYVGESERNIAAAFTEALARGAVLLFDEVDSFLTDRRGALRAWERSQTNEFLQQLEEYPGLVVCTTNLVEELDPAAMRRFTFKVRLRVPGPERALRLVRRVLARGGATPLDEHAERRVLRRLAALGGAAPGEVAAAERRLRALGLPLDADALLDAIAAEARAVRGPTARALGFGR